MNASRSGLPVWGIVLAAFAAEPQGLAAQSIVIQQPVVQQFGVSTVVSVPDRGSILLGSVGSARTFGRRGSVFAPGSAWDRRATSSGASASVWIHDLAATDAALLAGEKAPGPRRDTSALEGMAANAARQLLRDHRQVGTSFSAASSPPAQAAAASSLRRWGSRSLR